MQLRNRILALYDFAALLGAIFLSILIRFEGKFPRNYVDQYIWLFLSIAAFGVAVSYLFGLYKKLWRYAGISEAVLIFEALSLTYLPFIIAVLYSWPFFYPPRSVFVIAWMISLLLIGSARFGLRILSERAFTARGIARKRVLLVGAGDAGEAALRELSRRPELALQIVGLADDDPDMRKISIRGYRVLGKTADIPQLIEKFNLAEVIVAYPSPSLIRKVVEICRTTQVEIKVLPALEEVVKGRIKVSGLREVDIADLLERDEVKIDLKEAQDFFAGKTVLVSGAGGSIGSEICRQALRFKPKTLILLGRGENSIHEIAIELAAKYQTPLVKYIADIRDRTRMEHLFATYRPQLIFHAAAHKHVPLMEENVPEAVSVNVFGSRNLIELSTRYGVENFVLLSTDKAVKPTSIMGGSKCLAEMLLSLYGKNSATRFAAVRFGNVLSSRGSVIPTFRRQIALGGPVTVTDPEMTRFFMTIPEAVELVIQAGALSRANAGVNIYILDMGRTVKILDLAKNLIRLSGFEPDKDIAIQFTGTRPGEKLHEELINLGESSHPTSIQKINRVERFAFDEEKLKAGLEKMQKMVEENDEAGLRAQFKALLPGEN